MRAALDTDLSTCQTCAQVHGDEADEVLTKLLASPVAKPAAAGGGAAARPASPWADLKIPPAAAAGSSGTGLAASNRSVDDQPLAASPAAEAVRAARPLLQSGSAQPSPAAAAKSPAQSNLTPSALAAIAAKVGSGRRLLAVRSPAGRQVSMGEALNRAGRCTPATARRLEDSFAGSSGAAAPDAAVAPPLTDAGTQAVQQALAGSDVVLPSYLQAALAAADSSSVQGAQAPQGSAADSRQTAGAAPAQSRSKPAQEQAAKRELSEIERLPPVSQLDASVLDALPLHLKRELEMAYGAQLGLF